MPPADARAFWITGASRGELRSERLPDRRPDEALVRTLFSGISRGTETLVFAGAVPGSERERMRAPFQSGDFPAPVKYGYCNVGVVEDGPAALVGRTVFCLYPHQTRYVVPATAVHALPDDLPAERAVLAANLETAINCLWDAEVKIGDRVAVVGAGAVGSLLAWLVRRLPGTSVELIDVDRRKSAAAAALGVAFREPSAAARDADVVLHASGSAEGLALALELAAFEAVVLEASWYGDRRPAVPLGAAFHSRRLTLRSSQVGTVAAAQRSRWTPARRMQLALQLLRDPALDALISGESEFERLPDVLAELAAPGAYALCHRIRY